MIWIFCSISIFELCNRLWLFQHQLFSLCHNYVWCLLVCRFQWGPFSYEFKNSIFTPPIDIVHVSWFWSVIWWKQNSTHVENASLSDSIDLSMQSRAYWCKANTSMLHHSQVMTNIYTPSSCGWHSICFEICFPN